MLILIGQPMYKVKSEKDFIKQVTRGHNIVASGWAGAYDPLYTLPHPSLTHTRRQS